MDQKVFALRMAIGGTKDVIPEGLKTDTIIIGWSEAPELLTLREHESQRSAIQAAYGRELEVAGKQAKEVDRFLHQMRAGDLVLVGDRDGEHFYSACVVGDAKYRPEHQDDDTAFRRPVVWLNAKKPFRRAEVDSAIQDRLSGRGWTCRDATQIADAALSLLSDCDREILLRASQDRGLTVHEDYTREEVHDIFSPDTAFTPGAGLWGMQGPVPIKGREDDYVFFVSFGRKQGDHEYEDGITADGVLIWESKAKQRLDDRHVNKWIEHDDTRNTIYLFLRTQKGRLYTYLGRLKYLAHDGERQKPVYFQWQLLHGPVPATVVTRMGLDLLPAVSTPAPPAEPAKQSGLTLHQPPRRRAKGVSTTQFKARKSIDYSEQDSKNRKLGAAGEQLVYAYEKEQLKAQGHPHLAAKVRHIAQEEGDGAGYDVLSYHVSDGEKYIEVKTTRGGKTTPFFISSREIAFSELKAEQFALYRLYDYDAQTNSASFYELCGAVSATCELKPTQFRAAPGKA